MQPRASLVRLAASEPGAALAVAAVTLLTHAWIAAHWGLRGEFGKYALAAELYLRGELGAERLADFSPLYFSVWVVAKRVLADPVPWIHALQRLLAALCVALLFVLLRRRFGPRWALCGAAVLALDRHLLIYQHLFEPELCLLALLLAFLWWVERRGRLDAVAAGILAGLCLATRPNFLPVFALVPLVFFLRAHPGERWKARALAFCVPWLLMLVLLVLRSASIEGDPRTPMMNPGTVFFEGNNPLSQGTSAVYPPSVETLTLQSRGVPDSAHVHYREVARAAAETRLPISAVNAWWSERAFSFLRDEPLHGLRRLAGKLLFVFQGFRLHDIATAWRYDAVLGLVGFPFALLAALALLGMLLMASEWRSYLFEYLLVATQLGVMVVFYVSARQRLVLVPILLVFAVGATRRLCAQKRRAAGAWALAGLLALALALPNDAMRDQRSRHASMLAAEALHAALPVSGASEPIAWHTDDAVAMLAEVPWALEQLRPAGLSQERGSIEERIRERLEARGTGDPSRALDLGIFLLHLGQATAAIRVLEPLAEQPVAFYRGSDESSQPRFYLARARALLGEAGAATELLRQAERQAPGDPFVLAELAVLTGEPRWETRLVRYWGRIDADWQLGRALLTHGRGAEAVPRFAAIVAKLPEMRALRIYLAAALGASGELEQGAQEYLHAMRWGAEPVILERPIVDLFRAWLALHPEQPEARFYTASVLYQYGYLSEALGLLEGLETTAAEAQAGIVRAEIVRALANPDG